MAYEVKVSTGDVQAKASTIQRETSEIEARLSQLTSQMADLAGSWTGAASSSFQDLLQQWDKAARSMKDALGGIGRSLQGAGMDYDSLEQRLTSQFR